MKACRGYVCLVFLLLSWVLAEGVTVERITLVGRQAGIFTARVRVAVNTTTKSTLVVWESSHGDRTHHTLWGRLLNADGIPAGAAFQIVSGPNAQFHDVTYNPDANEFLLVYANEISGTMRFQVHAQRLTAAGRRAGKPLRVSAAADAGKSIANLYPRVFYDGRSMGYAVIWFRYAFAGAATDAQGLLGCVLNPNLTVRRAAALMSPLLGDAARVRGPYVSDLGFQASSGKLLLAGYYESTEPGFSFQYFVSRADPTLQKPQIVLTPLKPGLSTGAAPHASLAFLPGGSVAGLFVEGTGVRRRKLNPQGSPIGPVALFYTGAVQNVPLEFPTAALSGSGTAETAVVAIDDSSTGTGKLWIQTAGSSGAATGTPAELQSNLDIGSKPSITPLPGSTQSTFRYAVVYVDGVQRTAPPGPTESSGLVLLRVGTAP